METAVYYGFNRFEISTLKNSFYYILSLYFSRFLNFAPFLLFVVTACGDSEAPNPPIPANSSRVTFNLIQLENSNSSYPEIWEEEIRIHLKNTDTSEEFEWTIDLASPSDLNSITLPFGTYTYSYVSPEASEFNDFAEINLSGSVLLDQKEENLNLEGQRLNSRIIITSNQDISSPELIHPTAFPFQSISPNTYSLYTRSPEQFNFQIPISNTEKVNQYDQVPLGQEHLFQIEFGANNEQYDLNTIKIGAEGEVLSLVGLEIAELPSSQNETSALAMIEERLFSINDGDNSAQVHEIDPNSGEVLRSITIQNARNRDWEDLAQSDTHLFIGDFGNNLGARTDLVIYKISISDLLNQEEVVPEIINFSYANQDDFSNRNEHRFDCEAMIFFENQLHLFTKIGAQRESDHYTLENQSGTQFANLKETVGVNFSVTGADLDPETNKIILLGIDPLATSPYEQSISIFDPLQTDGKMGTQLNQIKIGNLNLRGNTEGIAIGSNRQLWISSEQFNFSGIIGEGPKLTLFSLEGIL